jgi:hypothetical protein
MTEKKCSKCRDVRAVGYCRDCKREYNKAYRCSERGKANVSKFNRSAKRKAYNLAYEQTEKRKASRKAYEQSERGKASNRARVDKYNRSEKGKSQKKAYDQTEKRKAYRKAYKKSERGKNAESWSEFRRREYILAYHRRYHQLKKLGPSFKPAYDQPIRYTSTSFVGDI